MFCQNKRRHQLRRALWAAQLGYTDAVALFDANLQEELATDQKLTQLGESSANPKGAKRRSPVRIAIIKKGRLEGDLFCLAQAPSSKRQSRHARTSIQANL
ncbi:DUF892 family protein [Pararhizobium sp. BT-229]|uniref:DUF892 family protein n=1 Tax=Pararhizobium sp. BT-229 TaxID=2986923 RepID=UPI003558AC91